MNKFKKVTLMDRIRAAVKSFKDGKPRHSIQLGLKVIRCDECERGNIEVHTNCADCPTKEAYERLKSLPDCNDCGDVRECTYAPQIGEPVRNNCPLHRPIKQEANR